jgi:hypothetical protein
VFFKLAVLLLADKKNKRLFGDTVAAPLKRTWCWRGGAGVPWGTAGWASR